jgi:hypothetical protein
MKQGRLGTILILAAFTPSSVKTFQAFNTANREQGAKKAEQFNLPF